MITCKHGVDLQEWVCLDCNWESLQPKGDPPHRCSYQCGACGTHQNVKNYATDPVKSIFALCDSCAATVKRG